MSFPIHISASLLAADSLCLGEEIDHVIQAQTDWIHLDIMDGHFVPNISFGPSIVKAVRQKTDSFLDVHLMMSPVTPLLSQFIAAGATLLSVHPEAESDIYRVLQSIRAQGCKTGVALNPGTPVDCLTNLLPIVDLILVMTVCPGFGGQSFIKEMLPKVAQVRQLIEGHRQKTGNNIFLQVDGGITPKQAPELIKAGADVLVVGSGIFGSPSSDYAKIIRELKLGL